MFTPAAMFIAVGKESFDGRVRIIVKGADHHNFAIGLLEHIEETVVPLTGSVETDGGQRRIAVAAGGSGGVDTDERDRQQGPLFESFDPQSRTIGPVRPLARGHDPPGSTLRLA